LEPASDRGASGGSLGAAAGLIAVIGVLGGLRYRRRRSPRRFAGPGASADLDSRSSELDGPPDDLIDEMLADIDLSNVLPEEWPDDVGAPSASAL